MIKELNLSHLFTAEVEPRVEPAGSTGRRPWYANPFLILSIPLLIQITPWWQPTEDATGYLSLAHCIATGSPLRMLGSRVLHYAIGYPLLIAPTYLLSQQPLMLAIVGNFVFAMLTAYGVFIWARRYVSSSAYLITGLTLWNASYWDLYRQPLSETAFLAALIWGAIACRKLLEVKEWRQIVIMTVVASLLLIVVSTIRQIGIFLAAGYGVAALIKAFEKETSWTRGITTTLCVGVPASVLLVALLLTYRSMAAGEENAHTYVDLIVDQQMTFSQQLVESFRLRTAEVGRQLVPGFFKAYGRFGQWLNVNTILYLIISGAVTYGWWKLARTDRDVLILTAPFYLAVYLLWPFDQGTRFMTPMLPVLWLCVWKLATIWLPNPNRLLGGLMVAHLAQAMVYLGIYLVGAQKCSADLESLTELAPAMKNDPAIVCGVGVSRQTQIAANLVLDRIIPAVKTGEDLPDDVKWVITSSTNPPVPGFEIEDRKGRLALLVRRE